MKLKKLFFACAESTGAEFYKNRAAKIDYLETHTQDFIELIEAAQMLRDDVADYVRINNLGDPFHNQNMRRIRAALQPFEGDK